jgi:hypothetical protein
MAQSVTTSYTPGINFSKYHTYRWVSIKGTEHGDPAVDAQIRESLDSQLIARGLVKGGETADLTVDYQVAHSKQQRVQTYEDWSLPGDYSDPRRQRLVTITEGSLALDIYDTAGKKLIWSGRATKTIDPKSTQEARKKTIDKAAQKLLQDFPPK